MKPAHRSPFAALAALLLLPLLLATGALGQTTFVTENFDTDGEGARYTSSAFDDGGSDFFERLTTNPDPRHNAGAFAGFAFTTPQSGPGYWGSEDIEDGMPSNPLGDHGIVRLNDVNVSGHNNLKVQVFLAQTDSRFDLNDKIEVQYAFDGNSGGTTLTAGSYATIGRFVGNGADIFADGAMKLDRDLDGGVFGDAGDAPEALLSNTMTEYIFDIPGTGNTLSIQIRIEQDGGTEELAFDHIRVTGDLAVSASPVLANTEGVALNYTEEGPATQITSAITVTDTDDTDLENATIQITSNLDPSEDVLALTGPPAGITVSAYVPATGLLTLTGTASLADYQTALRGVTYANTDLNDPSGATRTVSFQVSDGTSFSNIAGRDINVIPVIGMGTVPYVESFEFVDSTHGEGESYESSEFDSGAGIFNRVTGQPPQFLDPISGVDGSFYWAAEQTSNPGNPLSPDDKGYLKLQNLNASGLTDLNVTVALATSNDNNLRWEPNDKIEIQYAFDGDIGSSIDTGTYTTIGRFVGNGPDIFTGGDLTQDADLDGVADPGGIELTTTMQDFSFPIMGGGSVLSIRVLVDNDGSEEVAFDHIRVGGTPSVNSAPVLANIEGAALAYTEEDPAMQITGTITVADADDTDLESATIQITSNLDPAEDVLALTSPPAGITVSSYVPATGLLALTGTASLADYQTALRAVTYENTDLNDPSGATRTVSFQVSDGTSFSNIAGRDINVIPVIGTGTVPHVESFELLDSTHGEGESYESSEFDSGAGIFNRVTGQPPQFVDPISGVDGSFYWAAEQTSNPGNPLSPDDKGYLKLQNLNASGLTDLNVTVALATSNDNNLRWEPNDKIEIQYAFDGDIGSSIDTGTYTTIGRFIGNGPDIFTGGDLTQDADLDGVADPAGTELTTTLTEFAFSIPDTGNQLSIRVLVESDGSEEVAIDHIQVTGVRMEADLADPLNGGTIFSAVLNTRGYIDVTFTDAGAGLDTATIDGDEIVLSGASAAGVTLNGTATLVSGTTYRYAFTGSFVPGAVTVDFPAGSFADLDGNANAADTESFTVLNSPPDANPDTVDRHPTQSIKIPVATLLANDVDPDTGNNVGLTITGVTYTGGNGADVFLSGDTVFYNPPLGFTLPDTFDYTVQDSGGSSSSGTVTVNPVQDGGPTFNVTKVAIGGGTAVVTAAGIPGRAYRVQASADMTTWIDLPGGTVVADALGQISYTDPGPLPPIRFYRVVHP